MSTRWSRIFLGALAGASIARAWVPEPWPLWPDGSVSVAFEFAATAPNQTTPWNSAASDAIAMWNAHAQRVQITPIAASGKPQYDNGRNELFFSDRIYDEAFPSGVLAATLVTFEADVRVESDIVFNSKELWGVYNGAVQRPVADFRRVAVHELGHLLGLAHPDDVGQATTAMMNSTIGNLDTLSADDQSGIHALYDRGAGGAPVILNQPRAHTATQGAPTRLTVLAGGRGPLRYTWLRDGVPIPGATSSALSWDALKLEDGAVYSALVSNAGGSAASRDAQLTVAPAELPVVSLSGTVRNANAGDEISLSGFMNRGSFPMRYEWTRNGATVSVRNSPSGEHPRLVIADAQFGDSGDYQLIVTNAAGTVTTGLVRVNIAPGMPPRFTSDLPTRALAPSQTIQLMAAIDAAPSGKYQWKKNGVDIPGATAVSLFIPSFRPEDVGDYSVTITNAFGEATSKGGSLTLLNQGALQFLVHPVSKTEYEGSEVLIYTDLGSLNVTCRWFKDGVLLPDSLQGPNDPPFPLARVSGTRSSRLSIANTTMADAGVYVLEISDGVNVLRSRGARLSFLPLPKPVITMHPSHYNVAPGATITLSFFTRQPYATYTQSRNTDGLLFQWFKDGQPLPGQTRESLSFTAQPSDSGRYFGRATSASGFTDSEVAEVTVRDGNASLLPLQLGNWFVNPADSEEVRLMSVAVEVAMRRAGINAESYEWRRNGQSLGTSRSPFPGGAFVPGTYTLTVTGGGRTETSRPIVFGYQPAVVPVLTWHPESQTVDLGASVNLHVSTTAYSTLSYVWTRNGVTLPAATSGTLSIPNFAASDIGTYRVAVSNALGTTMSEPAEIQLRGSAGPTITSHPLGQIVSVGRSVTLEVSATGGALRYQWLREGQPIAGATNAQLFVFNSAAGIAAYSVMVSNGTSSVTSRVAEVRVLASQRPPEILMHPQSQTALLGGDLTLGVGADGGPLPDRYQWRKDGIDIPGATGAKLRLQNVGLDAAGSYSAMAFNANGSATSNVARVAVDAGGRLVNLATRASVGTGSDVLIAGFVIGGTSPRSVLVRGIGNQLSEFGVAGVLRNPLLRVFDRTSRVVATSDDWTRTNNDTTAALVDAAKQAGAFPLRSGSRDAAILTTLAPGNYTAQVSGVVDTTGVALVEIYELGKPDSNRLINLSSRAVVGTGANILIPGLVLSGQTPRRLLIRAVGPGLADFGVEQPLADPVMTVFRGSEIVAVNDNWSEQPGAATIGQSMAAIGAFALRPGSRDAALLLELPPDSYTVQVAGAQGTTGVALVEVYEIKP